MSQLNNLALLRMQQMNEEASQRNLAMTKNLSQLSISETGRDQFSSQIPNPVPIGAKIIRSNREWNVPLEKRTAVVYDDCNQNEEIRNDFIFAKNFI